MPGYVGLGFKPNSGDRTRLRSAGLLGASCPISCPTNKERARSKRRGFSADRNLPLPFTDYDHPVPLGRIRDGGSQKHSRKITSAMLRPLVVISGSDFEPRGSDPEDHRRILDALCDLGGYRFEYRPPRAIYDAPSPAAVVISEQKPLPSSRDGSTHEPTDHPPRPTLYMFHRNAGSSNGGEAWYADRYLDGAKTRVLDRTVDGRWVVPRLHLVKAFLEETLDVQKGEGKAVGSPGPTTTAMRLLGGVERRAPPRPGPSEHDVFISYLSVDSARVDCLVQALRGEGYSVWLDRSHLDVGARWRQEIASAIRTCRAMVACFSSAYGDREKSYMNEELTLAIEEIRARPTDRAWFFPVRLDDCSIPDRRISAGESLRDIQAIDLFPARRDLYRPLVKALARIPPR
jgi:TIR domain